MQHGCGYLINKCSGVSYDRRHAKEMSVSDTSSACHPPFLQPNHSWLGKPIGGPKTRLADYVQTLPLHVFCWAQYHQFYPDGIWPTALSASPFLHFRYSTSLLGEPGSPSTIQNSGVLYRDMGHNEMPWKDTEVNDTRMLRWMCEVTMTKCTICLMFIDYFTHV